MFRRRASRETVLAILAVAHVLAVGLCGFLSAQEEPESTGTIILDTQGYWRCHVTLRPPLAGTAADARPDPSFMGEMPEPSWRLAVKLSGAEWKKRPKVPALSLDQPTSPLPPADWMRVDFDDANWWRDPGPFFGGGGKIYQLFNPPHASRYGFVQTVALALFCARGKFTVSDPTQVQELRLSVEFRGGIVVYLNGREVTRKHLPPGKIDFETLAEDYPIELSLMLEPKSKKPRDRGISGIPREGAEPIRERLEKRIRRLENIPLPVEFLRKGTNVLALEIHRTAIHPELLELRRYGCLWSPVGLLQARLTAKGDSVLPNVERSAGVQVWNAKVTETVFDTDYGDPNEPLKPIHIVGTQNGTFSGKVVVESDVPIKGLRAEAAEMKLKGGSVILPASALKVRYPRLGRGEAYSKSSIPNVEGLLRFEVFADDPPAEVPVQEKRKTIYKDGQREYEYVRVGAVQPVWVTVRVPADASPGEYEGNLKIYVEDTDLVVVPVHLKVCAFRLPDPKDFVTHADFIQSPESVALYYNVPLWSDAHFALISKSLKLLSEVGNKTLYLPLICRTNFGNSQSMVRWLEKADGTYEHDYRPLERYLDLAQKCGLKPRVVCLQVWDYHVGHAAGMRWGHLGVSTLEPGPRPVPVSALDPTTGAVSEMMGPKYTDLEALAFWTPVARGIRARLRKRGLEGAMMVGIAGDSIPQKEVVMLWKELLPEAPWVGMAHGWGAQGMELYGEPVGYLAFVCGSWGVDPAIKRVYGWRNPEYTAYFPRLPDGLPIVFHRLCFEWNLQSGRQGMGRLAGDFFRIPSVRGAGVLSRRYPESSWHNINMRSAWLAPGPEGTVSTVMFDMAREGIQECEARIFIEKALLDDKLRAKLGEDLAQECQALLDERTRYLAWANEHSNVFTTAHSFLKVATGGVLGAQWYAGSDWQQRSEKLYSIAGEVMAALQKH